MNEQSQAQNQIIKDGLFKGKQLFDAMQKITSDDVRKFLKYVIARPDNYAGNTWKISETFATWMVSGSPTVIEK